MVYFLLTCLHVLCSALRDFFVSKLYFCKTDLNTEKLKKLFFLFEYSNTIQWAALDSLAGPFLVPGLYV